MNFLIKKQEYIESTVYNKYKKAETGFPMRNLKLMSTLMVVFLISFQTYAVDNPDVDMGVTQLNNEECVNQSYQQCLDQVCTTSDSTDCTQQCQSMAVDKCQQQQDE